MKLYAPFILLLALCTSTGVSAQKSAEGPSVKELNVFVPNAFTPNQDGHNDVFKPVISGPEIEYYELSILDRNGKEVFSSTDPSEVWNGTIPGSAYVTSPSIYIYFLKIKSVEDLGIQLYRGHVVMIR